MNKARYIYLAKSLDTIFWDDLFFEIAFVTDIVSGRILRIEVPTRDVIE